MPSTSRETASESIALEGLEVDLAPLFRGPPDDRCQFPRWGYVAAGQVELTFADHTERYRAGDAYYVPLGHPPVHHAGARIIGFRPTDPLGQAIGILMANLESGT